MAGSFWQQRGVSGRKATTGVQERGRELCSGWAWRPWGGVVSLVRGPTALPCSAAKPHKQRGRPRFLRSSGLKWGPGTPHFLAASVTELTPCPGPTRYSLHPDRPDLWPLPALPTAHGRLLASSFFFLSSWLQCVPDSSRSFCSAASNCLGGVRLGPPCQQHHLCWICCDLGAGLRQTLMWWFL